MLAKCFQPTGDADSDAPGCQTCSHRHREVGQELEGACAHLGGLCADTFLQGRLREGLLQPGCRQGSQESERARPPGPQARQTHHTRLCASKTRNLALKSPLMIPRGLAPAPGAGLRSS